uniref:Uncharacterized protein n=1 Tax=Ursus americanus TaxID=9643 RepID=A0A452SHQ4_URSAM
QAGCSAGRLTRPPAPQDLVSKLLQLHFTDGKTKGSRHPRPASPTSLSSYVVAETAVRSIRQAQAEDLALVDVDQLEKVLPQLPTLEFPDCTPGSDVVGKSQGQAV